MMRKVSFGGKDTQTIVKEVLLETAREAVRDVLADYPGWGIHSEVKEAIRQQAALIVKEPEIQESIRLQLIHWIKQQ